jgi:hypothetical protein
MQIFVNGIANKAWGEFKMYGLRSRGHCHPREITSSVLDKYKGKIK